MENKQVFIPDAARVGYKDGWAFIYWRDQTGKLKAVRIPTHTLLLTLLLHISFIG